MSVIIENPKELGLVPIPKSWYLAFLYVLFMQFWGMDDVEAGNDIENKLLIYTFIYLGLGIINYFFFRKHINPSFPKSFYWSIFLIFISFGLSMIMAMKYYGQPISQSMLTYRFQYLMITPIALVIIRPTIRDVINSLKLYAVIYTLVYVVVLTETYQLDFKKTEQSGIEGIELIVFLYFYYFCQLTQNFNARVLPIITALGVLIGVQENRSTLFPMLLLTFLLLFQVRSQYKVVMRLILLLILISLVYISIDFISSLINQTQSELADPKYNRNKALEYFLYTFSPSVWCDIFGNGFLSAHSSPKMASLMEYGVYNSDMGFLGYWNQFGIIPIVVFLYIYIITIAKSVFPKYLKMMSWMTLVCGLTISYFGMTVHMISYIMFLYLYGYYEANSIGNNREAGDEIFYVDSNQAVVWRI